ncbi:MAG: SpoIIE family protein phosphatase, partial [Bacilli bacterium]|nr:SpoIIE family protein phosphatase [Bacilli bacterium]
MAVSSFILLRSDRLAYIYRGDISTTGYYMVRICNFLVFATSLSLIYGFNHYLISMYIDNPKEEKKIPIILRITKILLLIGEILLIISQFTNSYYYFDENNIYHRGKFYIVCFIIPLIILIIQFIIIITYNEKEKKYIFIPLILFTILPIIATIIQLFFYGISLTNISSVGVVVVLYAFTIYDANHLIEEKGKLEKELLIARDIQMNECPNVYPAFPDREEFDLYAIMNPAKEVGGDFYDYFFLDKDHLALIMADVSGKGVPAALNMVKAKILLKGTGLYINNPAKVLGLLNEGFIDNNDLNMFVTVWFGILEIS